MAGRLRSDEDHVDALGRIDVAEPDVESVGEGERLARRQLVFDVVAVDRPLVLVGRQDHDQVGPLGRVGDAENLEAVFLSLRGGLRAVLQPDLHLDTRVAQVLRVSVPLRAVSDDRDLLALDEGDVGVFVVEEFSHVFRSYLGD